MMQRYKRKQVWSRKMRLSALSSVYEESDDSHRRLFIVYWQSANMLELAEKLSQFPTSATLVR